MDRLVAVILFPVWLAGCTQVTPAPAPPRPAVVQTPAAPVGEAAHAAFERYAALSPQTPDPPSSEQAPFFTDIEELLLGARKATSPWNRELFIRNAQDQFWRYGLGIAVAEKLSLAKPEDIAGFRELVGTRVEQIDRDNTVFLKAEVDRRGGWPPKSDVGDGGAHFSWLLVQHADRDPEFQRRVLGLMEPMVATGEVYGYDFAYLFDRVARAASQPQRFGTQGRCVAGENRWAPFEAEDAARLDERRLSVGLTPMAEYLAVFKERRLCEGQ